MIRSSGALFSRIAHRYVPHPFVFAILLTMIAFALGMLWTRTEPLTLLNAWYAGFWNASLLTFAFQMAIILVTGHALAETRPVRAGLDRLAGLARGTRSAAAITALVAMLAALLNWGLGLIVGALLAREMAREARHRGLRLHYPLVVAAGYMGLMVWHGGLSGSAPLSVATPGHPLEGMMGIIPIGRTLLSPLNLAVNLFLLISVPLALALMAPREAGAVEEAPAFEDPPRDAGVSGPRTPAAALENSRALVWVIVIGGLGFLIPYYSRAGWNGMNLNAINFTFLLAGLLLHGTPGRYARSIDQAVRGAGGILLQFPFYFGIMGLMQGAGLIEKLAGLFVGAAEAMARGGIPVGPAYDVLTFTSAAIVNLFVPSGGGQWAIQGPIAVEAAGRLGADLADTIMAFAYGDQITNMLQPFWALPLLAVTRLEARQIVGYTALVMFLAIPGIVLLLALLGS